MMHRTWMAIVGALLSLSAAAEAAPLYALSQGSTYDQLLGYDLAAQDPLAVGIQSNLAKLLDTRSLPSSSIVSIAVSGSMLYALSRGSAYDELLGYNLASQDPLAIGVRPNLVKLLDTRSLPSSSIVSIAVSGSTLYALSQGSTYDQLLGYDLAAQDPLAIGIQSNLAKLLDTRSLPSSSIVSIAASGSTLYALSQGAIYDQLLGYDLAAQDPLAIGIQSNLAKLLDPRSLPSSSIVGIAINGTVSTVPLPSGLPLAALGLLTLAAVGKLRRSPPKHCVS